MANNPKYGLTYKTSDGKTKTLTGINLGTGSYTSEQITAFVGIIAEVTNKTVIALDVTTANAIPPPEAPKDLIESFTISPSTLTATIGGDPVTAEITITTSTQDANYQLRIEDAPAWVSIDDTTIIFAPPAGTTPDHYLFTVVAMTKDDQAEFAVTLTTKQLLTPTLSLKISNTTYQDTTRTATLTANTNNTSGAPNWEWGAGTATITSGTNSKTKIIKGKYKDWSGSYYSFSQEGALTISAAGDYAESAIDFEVSGKYSDATTKEPIKITKQTRRY